MAVVLGKPGVGGLSEAVGVLREWPLVSVHGVLETINVPLFGLAALAAVGGATRVLGNRVIAVPGVVGGLAYAAAGATIAFTDALDSLFPLAGLIGVWAVAAGIWLLVRTRRSAATAGD